MSWLHFCILSVTYAGFFANCNKNQGLSPLKNELLFTFDLSKPTASVHYGLTHRPLFGTTSTRMVPFDGNRMTKLVDGHETVASFPPEHLVTEVSYTPRYNPRLLSVKYLKNNSLMTRRFRKTFVWSEVTLDDYNYLMFELTQAPLEVTLDVSNLDESKFDVRDDTYGQLKIKNITTTKGYQATRVVDGNQLLWEAEGDEKFSFGFVSLESSPKLLSFTVLNKDKYQVKSFTSFDDKFHEVNQAEFNFVFENFSVNINEEFVLDLDNLDTSKVEVSFATFDSVDFVNVHPNENLVVKKVVSGGFPLWTNSQFSRCLNVLFTTKSEPRLFNLLVSDTKEDKETKDYTIHFMKENDQFLGLPEDVYVQKLNSFKPAPAPEKVSYDLKKSMEKLAGDNLVTYFFSPGSKKVDRVVHGSDLVWASTNGERLGGLYLFKNKNKFLLQLSLFDKNNLFTNRYFQHSFTYFNVDEESLTKKDKDLFDGWLWLSTPEFFKNVAHVQLIKNVFPFDALRDPDHGTFEFKQAQFGNAAVRTFALLPSFSLSSLSYKGSELWNFSKNEELVAFAFYGPHRDLYNKSEKVGSMSEYNMAELFVKKDNKVVRNHFVLEVSGLTSTWNKVTESVFNDLYKKVQS